MRALLVTALAVIGVTSAGIAVLAIAPAPERASDSVTLVIETGSINETRSAASKQTGDVTAGEPENAPRRAADAGKKLSLDEVIAERLRAAEQAKKTKAKLSDSNDTASRPQHLAAASAESGPAPSGSASGQTSGTADSPSPDGFAPPETGSAPSDSISITQMLAAEIDEDGGTSDTAGSARPNTSQQQSATATPDASDTASESGNEAIIASLEPRIAQDTGTGDPSRVTPPIEAPETAGQPASRPRTQPEPLAAGDAPALPQKRGGFAVEGKIVLIIRGLGVKPDLTQRILDEMPNQVAMAFVPYGDGLQEWTRKARQGRHDVLLQIPLEPKDYPDTNPGPHTLLTSLSIDENLKRLDWLLNRFNGIVGVTNYLGGKFASEPGAFAPMLMELKARDLLYVDDGKAANETSRQLARQVSLGYSVSDFVIDKNKSPAAIQEALAELETKARKNGSAIAIGHAHASTLAELEGWMTSLNGKQLALVPIGELVTAPPARVSQSTGG